MANIEEFFKGKQERLQKLENNLRRDNLLVASELSNSERLLASEMVEAGILKSIDQRIFTTKKFPINDFLIRQLVLGQGIYYGNTALYLWQLSDSFPYTVELAVRMGYQVPEKRYPDWTKNVQFRQVREPHLSTDVERITVPNTQRTIKIYSPERVLVEMIKQTHSDKEIFKQGLQGYLKSPQRNLSKLMSVARRLNAAEKVQEIVGVVL
ncbi:type IV toxin-antitoxin system AbiEi family antitoxin domain-containing protein [Lentilactobacillus rapi]|uniref:Transcriptional regulator n=1 Tax=Lentilactobacillus rapi TaxID=481723 RepID=A0A512PNB9_9LACO|nr:hypothetical protein [Lentilactobacillus rapi]GEP72701.1 hypothetical protein LRA02_15690 [Lentilactobacillus rapi]